MFAQRVKNFYDAPRIDTYKRNQSVLACLLSHITLSSYQCLSDKNIYIYIFIHTLARSSDPWAQSKWQSGETTIVFRNKTSNKTNMYHVYHVCVLPPSSVRGVIVKFTWDRRGEAQVCAGSWRRRLQQHPWDRWLWSVLFVVIHLLLSLVLVLAHVMLLSKFLCAELYPCP